MPYQIAGPNFRVRNLLGAVALVFAASSGVAEYVQVPACGSVSEVADRFEAAAQKSGPPWRWKCPMRRW
ncbi:hypothetical protein AB4874_17480 [Thioclava sp. 15-R06ZXC-3]|uniref:Uncharacterized protein n=1 Tax=Thioclava arctica TaxID=3238301 RepID=A0ABV3TPG2_9RHOB